MFRLDRDAALARLRARAAALLADRADVVEVRLFGSLAHGGAGPGSDADLFVLLHDGAAPFLDRVADLGRRFSGVGIGCDVVAFTESELAQMAAGGRRFARTVAAGLLLASRREPA